LVSAVKRENREHQARKGEKKVATGWGKKPDAQAGTAPKEERESLLHV